MNQIISPLKNEMKVSVKKIYPKDIKIANEIIQWYLKLKDSENNLKNSNFYKLINPSQLWLNVIKDKHRVNIDKINNNDIIGLAKTLKNL